MSKLRLFPSQIACLAVLVGGSLLLIACTHRERIESINRDPGRLHDKEITVAGRVVNSFVIMSTSAFEIDDGTGRLWVLSDKYGIPGHNSSATVTGKIEQGFGFGGRTFVVILRETRKGS